MITVGALVDAASCVPWFFELAAFVSTDVPNMTWIRTVAIFRMLKTEEMFHNFEVVYRVFFYNRTILALAGFVCLVMLLFTSTMVYYLGPGKVLDDADYTSIPQTMYLCVLMLTGEWAPTTPSLTWYSKLSQGLVACFSVGLFAIPASMLTWGFEAEAERLADKNRQRVKELKMATKNGKVVSDSSPSGDEANDDSWDEYEDIISGGSIAEEEEEVKRWKMVEDIHTNMAALMEQNKLLTAQVAEMDQRMKEMSKG